AEADVAEEPRRLIVEAPAHADADFKVGRYQEVSARTDVVFAEILLPVLGEKAEVLGVDLPALTKRHAQHRGRRPDIEPVALLVVGDAEDGRIPAPLVRQFPAPDVPDRQLRGGSLAAERRVPLDDGAALRQPVTLLGYLHFDAVEDGAFAMNVGAF